MMLMPLIVVSDLAASTAFYARLGFPVHLRARNGEWVELAGQGGARLGIQRRRGGEVDTTGLLGIAVVADRPLEKLTAELAPHGITATDGIIDESFGRVMTVHDPDGTPISIVELDQELYT